MKEGDFVYVDYVGRLKDNNEIFDLTREDVAKAEGVYNPKLKYKPVVVIVGGGFAIKGLDDAIKSMHVNEKKTVELEAKDAFGERRAELVKLIPTSQFKEQNITPVPGAYVSIGQLRGRIVSVSGGRVKVDFNHPLAGKALKYEIEIKKQITDTKEKVKAVVSYFIGVEDDDFDVSIEDTKKEVEITFKKPVDVPRVVKEMVAKTLIRWVENAEKIKFTDVFEKRETAAEK